MSGLCGAPSKKLAHDAEKVAERLQEGLPIYQCRKCKRLSHKAEHLCKPLTVGIYPMDPKELKEAPAPEDPEAEDGRPVGDDKG